MKALDIFEEKYPGVDGQWISGSSTSHLKKPEDCLNPDRTNVSDGGKQPFLRHSREWDNSETDTGRWAGQQKLEERVLIPRR